MCSLQLFVSLGESAQLSLESLLLHGGRGTRFAPDVTEGATQLLGPHERPRFQGLPRRARQESNLRPRAPEARALSPELLALGRGSVYRRASGPVSWRLAGFRPNQDDAGDGVLSRAAGGLRPGRPVRGLVRLLFLPRVEVPAVGRDAAAACVLDLAARPTQWRKPQPRSARRPPVRVGRRGVRTDAAPGRGDSRPRPRR